MNMPGMGGLETCRLIRGQSEIAIIMLTVRDTETDKVEALDAGADDYVTKPFNAPELLARIRAALRRTPSTHGPAGRLAIGDVEVDFDTRQVTVARQAGAPDTEGVRAAAVPRRARRTRCCPHRELLQSVWGPDYGDQVDYLRVFVNQLRKKIEIKPSSPAHLLTEPWVGYRLFLPTDPH